MDAFEKIVLDYGFLRVEGSKNKFEKFLGTNMMEGISIWAIFDNFGDYDGVNLFLAVSHSGEPLKYVTHSRISDGTTEENEAKLKTALEGLKVISKF